MKWGKKWKKKRHVYALFPLRTPDICSAFTVVSRPLIIFLVLKLFEMRLESEPLLSCWLGDGLVVG